MLGSRFQVLARGDSRRCARRLRALGLVLREELTPRRLAQPALVDLLLLQRPVVVVVEDLAEEDRARDQRRPHDDLLEELRRPEPRQVAEDAVQVRTDLEPPRLARDVITNDP